MAQFALIFAICACAFIVPEITAKTVTYPGIGTFDSHDFYDPKHRPLVEAFLPQSPEHIDPEFLLFTRKEHKNAVKLHFNHSETISSSTFDGSKPTSVLVHGFIDNQLFGEWMAKLKDVILEHEDVNVITVDWHKGNFFPYDQATVNTRVVGAMLGIQIELLCKLKNTKPSQFHLMGHSLGAHIVGYAGKWLKGEVGRITGMDPAGPMFQGLPPAARLWHTDAKYVDSIHTDARPLIEIGFGMYETCSHVDIYPNGGRQQPGCNEERLTSAIFKGIFEGARRLVACNHQRAVDYMIDSYNTNIPLPKAYQCSSYDDFLAGKCTDCGANGEKCAILGKRNIEYRNSVADINQGVDGVNGKRFFMITGSHEPLLSSYQYILTIHMAEHGLVERDITSVLHVKFVDKSGRSEEFHFNDKAGLEGTFNSGDVHTHPGTLSIDPSNVAKLDLEWDHGSLPDVDLLHLEKMHIDRLEVIGLSTSVSTTKSAPIKMKYCNKNSGIPSKKHIQFDLC